MSSLLLGKCISTAKKNTIKLLIPQMKFDSFLNKHYRENDTILALDQNNRCEPGDWVLLKKFEQKYRLNIDYSVEKIVYKSGEIIDPITKKKTLGYNNIEDFEQLATFLQKK